MRTRKGHLYLIDFGIARLFRPEKKRDTGPLGSPGYAAPEQYGRAQSTIQTDIYGLGATLQTLLTGQEPADDGPGTPASRQAHQNTRELLQLLYEMQEMVASRRPRNMWDVKKQLQYIRVRRRNPALLALCRNGFSFLVGLLIGALPYVLMPLFLAPNPAILPLLPFAIMAALWPIALACRCLAALHFYFLSRRRLMACGILIMLALVYLAIHFGLLPSPTSLFDR